MVDRQLFIQCLKRVLRLNEEDEAVFSYVLGRSNAAHLSPSSPTSPFLPFNPHPSDSSDFIIALCTDHTNSGFINQHKFNEFLTAFGPVADCSKNVKKVLSQPYVHFSLLLPYCHHTRNYLFTLTLACHTYVLVHVRKN